MDLPFAASSWTLVLTLCNAAFSSKRVDGDASFMDVKVVGRLFASAVSDLLSTLGS